MSPVQSWYLALVIFIMALFVTSDLHLGHEKSLQFVDPNGQRIRPFESLEHMHSTIINNWNKVVHQKDTIYVLGDVVIPRSALALLNELKGRKVLIHGNHDTYKTNDYLKYFDQIRGVGFKDRLFFTHIPIHPDTFENRIIGNVHGHLHCHRVKKDGVIDPRYFSVCLEVNNFTPVSWDTIKSHFGLE
jgi:calcineurin-like phosphoesterase family protein